MFIKNKLRSMKAKRIEKFLSSECKKVIYKGDENSHYIKIYKAEFLTSCGDVMKYKAKLYIYNKEAKKMLETYNVKKSFALAERAEYIAELSYEEMENYLERARTHEELESIKEINLS